MAVTLKETIVEHTLLLNHNYHIQPGTAEHGGGYVLKCGQGFVYWDMSLDKVLSRYCMQVVDDCVFAGF